MAAGDHIRVKRKLYWHHGIEMRDGTVIHASGEPGRMKLDAEVRRSRFEDFARGGRVEVANRGERLPADQIERRARAALGERNYSLLFNNCEHFARWCETGEADSRQVDSAALAGVAVGLGTRIALGIAARRLGTTVAMRLIPLAGPASIALALAGTAVALHSKRRSNDSKKARKWA